MLRLSTLPGSDFITSAFDDLIERKRLRYADDDRAVGNWELPSSTTARSLCGRGARR